MLENAAGVDERPSSTFTVKISNDNIINGTIQIKGFFRSGIIKSCTKFRLGEKMQLGTLIRLIELKLKRLTN
ncbi:hypothetical protein [Desulfosporosinus sp. FKB]|uniref:hypothetical protein n=1 Tax=Desulfosporosinus sp. FKB TaxID=1969835 RepID=UPI001A9A334D|nr:hypothetical protein [Desulfosporosinus sp. FKB]